ncbi:aminopeptidase [Halococcoides cellulosivorans]|uniref:Aminopeptidase n=1 Tax=Halococcoides cellulosivorans TaxID=1679096 RepID=A0A2R4X4A9_9EURY|nr:aminopeptidase [Halococcoides cellulosivorans]
MDGVDRSAVVTDDQLSVTPHQHERLKDALHGHDRFDDLARAATTYLVVGSGAADGPGRRRRQVCRQLDERPMAAAVRLETFGLTDDDIDLWAPAFDILSAMASHVVGVLEDFDGGHVWELGYLYHHQRHVRDVLWLLKRIYETDAEMREQYDNGMAASHLAALEAAAGDNVLTWSDEDDLPDAVREIP